MYSMDVDITGLREVDRTLFMFSGHGDMVMVQAVLAEGANLNVQDGHGWTPLMYTIIHFGRTRRRKRTTMKVIKTLLEHGADVTITDKQGQTAAGHARSLNLPYIARLLERATKKPSA